MIDRTSFAVLLGLLTLTCGLQCPKQRQSPGREVVCYTSVTKVQQLTEAVCKCTTLVQQGHDVQNLSISEFEEFRKSLKEIIPPLQFVVSVDDPGQTLRTSGTVRQDIIARLIGVLKEVDGVELNMTAGSKERLVQFVTDLKDELTRKSYDKRIFLVLPTKSEDLAKQFDLKKLSKYADLFTIPTHYLVEDDEAYRTFHPSRLMGLFDMFNADSLIDLISGLGAPKRKILMSLPASAYEFTLKDQDDNAPRAPTEEMQPVIIDQKQLCDLMKSGEWTVERDEDLTAPYAFKNNMWIAFEDRISVAIKGKYALLRDLPGLAIHDIENDYKTDCGMTLTHNIHHSFSDFKRKSRAAVLNALEDDLHQRELEYPTKVKSSDFRVVRVVDTEGHIRAVRENTQTEFTCSRQGYFVHPKSCNRFYRCVKFNQEVEDYSVFEFDCPAGLSFDERTEVCVWPGSMPEGSPCPGSSEIAPVARIRFECPAKSGYYADPQNPRWFFACIDLGGPEIMAYEFRCPFGLIFDEQKLVCEWPWLVAGYSGTAYAGTEYDNRGYGTGTTPGVGGYYTGGLPHGYTGTTGGEYTVSSGGIGSGYAGQTGGGYTGGGHGSTFGQGGTGHAGAATGGTSYTGKLPGGYTGATGTGYSGIAAGGDHRASYGGQGSGGYSGTSGGDLSGGVGAGSQRTTYGGQGSGVYTGTTGSGYSGAAGAGGHGTSYGGQGSGGYSGATGSGLSGGAGAGDHRTTYGGQGSGVYTGTTGSAYSGAAGAGGHGTSYGGQGSGVYTGTTGSAYSGAAGAGGHGTSYSGQGTGGYTGATGTGLSGGAGAGAGDHRTSYGGQGSGVYTGTTGSAYSGAAGAGGQGTGGYSGATGSDLSGGAGAGGHGTSYGGQGSGVYTGTTGSAYSGAAGAGGHGTSYGGQGTGGYSGATGSDLSGGAGAGGHGTSYGGQGSGVYTGTTGSAYSGAAGAGGQRTPYGGQVPGGDSGTTGSRYPGSETSQTGGHGYSGTIGTGQVSTGVGYTGAGGVGHSGTSGIYTGTTGTGYTGSSATPGQGYPGQSPITHGTGSGSIDGGYSGTGGIRGGSSGGIYTGTTSGAHAGSTGGYVGPGGIHGGSSAGGYTGTGGAHGGATGGYAGGSGGTQVTVTEDYSGAEIKGGRYPGSSGAQYPKQGPTIPGSTGTTGHVYPGQTGTKYSGSGLGGHDGSSIPGKPDVFGTQPTQTPIYASSGTIGTGIDSTRVTGIYSQTPGPVLVEKPDRPTCITCSQSPGGQTYATDISGHGVTSGTSIYHGASGSTGSLNATYRGHVPSIGSTTYHGAITPTGGYSVTTGTGGGAIVTGHGIPGTIITGDSSQGTLITHGGTSGTVFAGSSDQGSIITGGGHPGYTKTGSGTPGYVISDGVKTVYSGSASPGTVVYGTSSPGVVVTGAPGAGTIIKGQTAPGVVLTGQTAPGIVLTGQTAPGVLLTGQTAPGGVLTGHTAPGLVLTGQTAPGGVLTGHTAPGLVLTGQTASGAILTGHTAPGGSLGGSIGHGTIIGPTGQHAFTDSGYSTKPGGATPGSSYGNKAGGSTYDTGYKTNEYYDNGGRGTIRFNNGDVTTKYTENDIPDYRPAGGTIPPDTLLPGSKDSSISGGFTKTGPTKTGFTTATLGAGGSYVISTGKPSPTPNTENIGAKAFAGNVAGYTKSSTESSIENYSRTTLTHGQDIGQRPINLGPSKGAGYSYPTPSIPFETGVTKVSPIASTESSIISTATPTPYLNIEIYNTPGFGDSGSIGSPTVPSTYQKPSGFTRAPIPTVTPGGYTTGPLDGYKTTAFQTGKVPITISTVQPVFDTGYDTFGSSTPIPGTLTQSKHDGGVQTGSKFDFVTKTSPQGSYDYTTPLGSIFNVPTRKPYTRPPFIVASGGASPDSAYFTTPKTAFGEDVTPSGILKSQRPQYVPGDSILPTGDGTYQKPGVTYQQSTLLTSGGSKTYTSGPPGYTVPSGGGSPTNLDIPRNEVGKLITNYNRGTTKYIPNKYDIYTTGAISGADYSRTQSSSSTIRQDYGSSTPSSITGTQTPFSVTTYSGGYSRPTSITSYQTTAKSTAVGKAKVIVKWSDLHPLLLGKLGAECTCRGDPFANLRGPGSKLIDSSKGKVDLSNYDESEIYVDLEKDSSDENQDYVTTYESSSKGPVKIWNNQIAQILSSSSSQAQETPSSSYLPSVTPSSSLGARASISGFSNRGHTANFRSGKSLSNVASSTNSIGIAKDFNSPVDRSAGDGESEEIIDGATNCARPGLFRHPNFCSKFYACHWDEWKKKFTLHVFNCPVHLTFDSGAGACNWPSMGPACQDDNLLV